MTAQSPKKKTPAPTPKKRGLAKLILKWSFVLGLWVFIIGGLVAAWYAAELPKLTSQASFERRSALTVKAADGSVIARYGDAKGESLSVAELPPNLIHAVIAIEDRRFYSHMGIDILGLARAMYTNVKSGRLVQGGSTITQQLAKNLFLSHERTIKRKIQEAMLAFWLEHELTKDEILSAYLNRVYLGSGTYGVEAATQLYFNKSATDINLKEAATIAGLLKAPSRYSPLNNPGLSQKRARVVLAAMADAGYISDAEKSNLTMATPKPKSKPTGISATRYYSDWVLDGLKDLIGTPNADLIIETSLDPNIQKHAEKALSAALRKNQDALNVSQGAVLVMRPDGAVLAMIGGRDYTTSQFNRAIQAKRQPGSAFKPILYLSAIEQGYTPTSILLDAPFTTGDYRPKNYSDQYYGEVTLENALAQSLNTPAVRLAKEIGTQNIIKTAKRLGIFSPLEKDLSLALGSSALSLMELTTAYASFANGGLAAYPYAITKITGTDGTLYYQRPDTRKTRRIIKNQYAQAMSDMLRLTMTHGTGRAARLPFPTSGKTGTSQDNRDAWFIGYSNELVTGVWLGNDNNAPMKGVTGGSLPATIWKDIMKESRGIHDATRRSDFSTSGFSDFIQRLLND